MKLLFSVLAVIAAVSATRVVSSTCTGALNQDIQCCLQDGSVCADVGANADAQLLCQDAAQDTAGRCCFEALAATGNVWSAAASCEPLYQNSHCVKDAAGTKFECGTMTTGKEFVRITLDFATSTAYPTALQDADVNVKLLEGLKALYTVDDLDNYYITKTLVPNGFTVTYAVKAIEGTSFVAAAKTAAEVTNALTAPLALLSTNGFTVFPTVQPVVPTGGVFFPTDAPTMDTLSPIVAPADNNNGRSLRWRYLIWRWIQQQLLWWYF